MSNNINTAPVNVDTSLLNQAVKKSEASVSNDNSDDIDSQIILAEKLEKIDVNKKQSLKSENKTDAKDVDEAEIDKALELVSTFVNTAIKSVDFTTDNSSGKMIIKVSDKQTQEIIQQFPSEKLILMAEKIKELQQDMQGLTGLLIDSHI